MICAISCVDFACLFHATFVCNICVDHGCYKTRHLSKIISLGQTKHIGPLQVQDKNSFSSFPLLSLKTLSISQTQYSVMASLVLIAPPPTPISSHSLTHASRFSFSKSQALGTSLSSASLSVSTVTSPTVPSGTQLPISLSLSLSLSL